MKTSIATLITFFALICVSCSSDDDNSTLSQSIIDCELNVTPDTLVRICMNGPEFALPSETLTFVSKFTSNTTFNAQILWVIESGNMNILDVESTTIDGITKSIVTIEFESNFSGGTISVFAEDDISSAAITGYSIALENI